MDENNNMNNNYTNDPAAQQPEQPQQSQPAGSTMYHYNEQGTGQYQQDTQNTQYQQNTQQSQNVGGQYHYADAAQQTQDAQQEEAAQQTYQYGSADQTGSYPYGDAGQQYQYSDNTTQNSGDQFTGGQQSYNAGNYTSYPAAGSNGQQPAHGKAVASLILGIAGLVCCGICGLIGLILSISAKNEGNTEGIRTAGFVLGIIGCVLWAVGVVAAIINGAFTATL